MLVGPNIAGAVSEAMVAGYLGSRGFEVFAAAQPHSRADLVYVTEAATVKVQVKTASWAAGTGTTHKYEQCRLVRKGTSKPYQDHEVDEVWIVGTHLWCFPLSVLLGRTSLFLSTDNAAPRKTVRDYNPNDYIVVPGAFERPYRDRLFSPDIDPSYTESNTNYTAASARKMERSARRQKLD